VQFAQIEKVSDLDIHLGSGQGHISMRNTYRNTSVPDHVTLSSSNMEMAISNTCNVDIPRSLNSHYSFLKRKFENRAPTSCRLRPALSKL